MIVVLYLCWVGDGRENPEPGRVQGWEPSWVMIMEMGTCGTKLGHDNGDGNLWNQGGS